MGEEAIVSGNTGYKPPVIERAAIGSIVIYEVTDLELADLKKGDDGGIKLASASFCLSSSLTLLTTILTCTLDTQFKQGCFVASCAFLGLIGVVLSIMSWFSKKHTDRIYETIKKRKPGESK
ncbi:hypothetical protein MUN53_08615 [Parabacteroides sp. AGMB00274]|uniref:Uncharacterized protein n=1 Tax=Parabacteroides faecalis TaxID=2924040 RepID=A0ABT0C0X5_9BACT|nr:hypothetical protein [Parabacteroides faecalis]MCJ2380669.1 hypothetical protein [Parabacteroides faecalis]